MAGIDQAAVNALALAFSNAHGGTVATTEEIVVAQAIADLVLKATVPAGITVQVTPTTGTGATSGIGGLL